MSNEKLREWVQWRLSATPHPTGTASQRRLGAAEVLLDMLLKVTPPAQSDLIVTLVESSAAEGQPYAIAHKWLMEAWARDMQRQVNGEPRRLECPGVEDSEAVRLTKHAVGLLGMYVRGADPGTVDVISSAVSRQILQQPRLQGLTKEEINNKLAIRDGFLMGGVEAHLLSLDILTLLVEVEARVDLARAASSSTATASSAAPTPGPPRVRILGPQKPKKWWQF